MYRTKAIYQLSDLKQSSWKILGLFEIYRQSGSQAPVYHSAGKRDRDPNPPPVACSKVAEGGREL